MIENKFKRYLWLVNTIRSFGPISFEEINGHWHRSVLNLEGGDLPKKTFRNHCEMIAEVFGIEVKCERKGGYRYHLDRALESDRWTASFLDTLSVRSAIEDDPGMRDRILLKENDFHPLLPMMLDYVKNRKVISFRLFAEGDGQGQQDVDLYYPFFCPLGLVHIGYNWFVVSIFFKNEGEGGDRPLLVTALGMMKDIAEVIDMKCEDYPEDFSVRQYIDGFEFDLQNPGLPDCKVMLALELDRLKAEKK